MAVEAITDKLSEVTGLAEQLDASLCGMQNGASIKRILDGTTTTTPQVCTQWQPSEPSGHYMYHQFNIHKFYVLPTHCIYVFVWISEQTAINSLHSINWLVCMTQTESVYCAVRTGCLTKIKVTLSLFFQTPNHAETAGYLSITRS